MGRHVLPLDDVSYAELQQWPDAAAGTSCTTARWAWFPLLCCGIGEPRSTHEVVRDYEERLDGRVVPAPFDIVFPERGSASPNTGSSILPGTRSRSMSCARRVRALRRRGRRRDGVVADAAW